MKKLLLTASLFLIGLYSCSNNRQIKSGKNIIKPYSENPAYWQYKAKPILLLGGSDNDNLFQWTADKLIPHLDTLKAAGGNYIRNTMSDRDEGDIRAFLKTADGKYDLSKWNNEYWRRFENLLRFTSERDIIVQIEIWDRFDHIDNYWLTDPYNPQNNINYSYIEAGLDSVYPLGRNFQESIDKQPFFYTVPELNNNEILLNYQKAFVIKLLSISLQYNNILYCIDNETSAAEEWAIFWAKFIQENSQGKDIYITEMWDAWDVKSETHKRTLDHPERYRYIDISQNSHNPGYANWENAQYVFSYIKDNPRPVNSTKIYGCDIYERWQYRGMTSEHAIQTFFRNVIGGYASSRFHRPPAGLGLSLPAINCIKTIRKIEEQVKMWELTPRMDLLKIVENNQAYLAAKEGVVYLVYCTGPGIVKIDLSQHDNTFILKWIIIENAEWGITDEIKGGRVVDLNAIDENGSLAVLIKK